MIKFIELHDLNTNELEYLDVEQISNVMSHKINAQEEVLLQTGSYFSRGIKIPAVEAKSGSKVHMKNGAVTYVKETPKEVIDIIEAGLK